MDHQNPHGGLPIRLVCRPSTTQSAALGLRKSLLGGHVHHAFNRPRARAPLFAPPADAMQRQIGRGVAAVVSVVDGEAAVVVSVSDDLEG